MALRQAIILVLTVWQSVIVGMALRQAIILVLTVWQSVFVGMALRQAIIIVLADHYLVMAEIQAGMSMNKTHKEKRVRKYSVQILEN
jgi:hypothetical protein